MPACQHFLTDLTVTGNQGHRIDAGLVAQQLGVVVTKLLFHLVHHPLEQFIQRRGGGDFLRNLGAHPHLVTAALGRFGQAAFEAFLLGDVAGDGRYKPDLTLRCVMGHDDTGNGDLWPIERLQRHLARPDTVFRDLFKDGAQEFFLYPGRQEVVDLVLADVGVGGNAQHLFAGGVEIGGKAVGGSGGDHVGRAFQDVDQPAALFFGLAFGGDVLQGAHRCHPPAVIDQAGVEVDQDVFTVIPAYQVHFVAGRDVFAGLAAAVVFGHGCHVFGGNNLDEIRLGQFFDGGAHHARKRLVDEAQFPVLDHEQTFLHVPDQRPVTFF